LCAFVAAELLTNNGKIAKTLSNPALTANPGVNHSEKLHLTANSEANHSELFRTFNRNFFALEIAIKLESLTMFMKLSTKLIVLGVLVICSGAKDTSQDKCERLNGKVTQLKVHYEYWNGANVTLQDGLASRACVAMYPSDSHLVLDLRVFDTPTIAGTLLKKMTYPLSPYFVSVNQLEDDTCKQLGGAAAIMGVSRIDSHERSHQEPHRYSVCTFADGSFVNAKALVFTSWSSFDNPRFSPFRSLLNETISIKTFTNMSIPRNYGAVFHAAFAPCTKKADCANATMCGNPATHCSNGLCKPTPSDRPDCVNNACPVSEMAVQSQDNWYCIPNFDSSFCHQNKCHTIFDRVH